MSIATCAHGYSLNEPCRHCRPTKRRERAHNSTLAKPARPMPKRNAKRAPETFARKYDSEDRVLFVKHLPCIVPGCTSDWRLRENAHGDDEKEGAFQGSHLTINPLCGFHHRLSKDSYHALGSERAFEERWLLPHGLTWGECAKWTEEKWRVDGPEWVVQYHALANAGVV